MKLQDVEAKDLEQAPYPTPSLEEVLEAWQEMGGDPRITLGDALSPQARLESPEPEPDAA